MTPSRHQSLLLFVPYPHDAPEVCLAGKDDAGSRGGLNEELVTLAPENGQANAVVEACRRCRGYVKSLTRLQAGPPAGVHLDDLATVDLDIAALDEKYERPGGTGYPLTVTVG